MEVLTYRRIDKFGNLVEFRYSECDKHLVDKYTWFINDGYPIAHIKGSNIKKMLHRLIMGDPYKLQVDHIDMDKTNNTRENLRICTQQNNIRNRQKQANNKSGKKGVCWHKASKKWVAQITIEGKRTYLGTYETIDEAYEVYCKVEKEHFGEYQRKKI